MCIRRIAKRASDFHGIKQAEGQKKWSRKDRDQKRRALVEFFVFLGKKWNFEWDGKLLQGWEQGSGLDLISIFH